MKEYNFRNRGQSEINKWLAMKGGLQMRTNNRAILTALGLLAVLIATSANAQWTNTTPNINNTNPGNVGINTTTPQYKLDVVGPAQAGVASPVVNVTIPDTLGNRGGFSILNTSGSALGGFSAQVTTPGAYPNAAGRLDLWTQNGCCTLIAMSVSAAGFIGIGTTTPTARLDVNGDLNVSGNVAAKYQDVAEWVDAEPDIDAGTVVVLDRNTQNRVRSSFSAYDTAVAGVVSSNPGIILGEAGEGRVRVATTGRVKVKVDATRHSVRVGDLLVTSGRKGVAMVSQPVTINGIRMHRPGTIIGKALQPLSSGEGEILVLLSLQ